MPTFLLLSVFLSDLSITAFTNLLACYFRTMQALFSLSVPAEILHHPKCTSKATGCVSLIVTFVDRVIKPSERFCKRNSHLLLLFFVISR